MARGKAAANQKTLVLRSLTLRPALTQTLEHLGRDVTPVLGRPISAVAVARALVRGAGG